MWLWLLLLFLYPCSHAVRLEGICRWKIDGFLKRLIDEDGQPKIISRAERAALAGQAGNCDVAFAYIVWLKARAAMGLPEIEWKPSCFARAQHNPPSTQALIRRFQKLLSELDRLDTLGARLAARWREEQAATELEDLTGTLSTRIPREGGGPDSRVSANLLCRLISALRALAGRPPARAKRPMGFAIRDGPMITA
jgi:hypothetical protein